MNKGEIILGQNQQGNIKIDIRLKEDTVWLTQTQMAELFGKGRTTITEHIQNVFAEDELKEHVAIEGKTKESSTPVSYNFALL